MNALGRGLVVAVLATVLASCSSSTVADDLRRASATTTTVAPVTTTIPPVKCDDATASARPPSQMPSPLHMPAGSYMAEIQQRGRLIIGTADDTLLFGFLNPLTNHIEGFDVDIAREV